MALISNLIASSIHKHLTDDLSNALHLVKRESITACKVAWRTRWRDIAFDVRLAVFNPV